MIQINNYSVLGDIYSSDNTLILKAKRDKDNIPVIIKILKNEYPTSEDILKFSHEYEITKKLSNVHGVIKALDFIYIKKYPAIVMEDINGLSLDKIIDNQTIDVKLFLEIAVKISEILNEIHNHNIIHKDIKPSNIIVNLNEKTVKIIDFSISNELLKENSDSINTDRLEGTLAYISPERTGRMNRSIDYRTDYYSLGICFYEILTGKLPYYSKDPLELIYYHIAQEPISPSKINNEIPVFLSNIILKLLSKNAEDRYQSADGLIYDLKKCLQNLNKKNNIKLKAGSHDFSNKFQIPEKLYGRQKEIETIFNSLNKIIKGKKEIIFFGGAPGIGKTTIINEVKKNIFKKHYIFISGNYEQYKRNMPYLAIIEAFKDIIKLLLTEKKETLDIWKNKLLSALGQNAKLITNIIPELELIIGKQPDISISSSDEDQNRFKVIFSSFVKVFTANDNNLILFIDNLQWADNESILLIEYILSDPELNHFLFLGAYRDKEIESSIFSTTLINLINNQNIINIKLKPLSEFYINQIIIDTLHSTDINTGNISKIIYKKTLGNPFFVKEFINTLYEKKIIYFNKKWIINYSKIKDIDLTNNVIDLMIERISMLDKEVLKTIKIASCIGLITDLNQLLRLINCNEQELLNQLKIMINHGYIIKTGDSIKFIHDKIREAVYSLISDEEKKEIHYLTGIDLLNVYLKNKNEDLLFKVVSHLNLVIDILKNNEKQQLSDLNYKAGSIAKKSASFINASDYFKISLNLLDKYSWDNQYDFTLNLYAELIESEYALTNYDNAQKLINEALPYIKNTSDKLRLYYVLLRYYSNQTQFKKAIDLGIKLINELDYKFPTIKKINFFYILKELIKFNYLINKKKKEFGVKNIIDLKKMKPTNDKKINSILNILLFVGLPCYTTYPEKYPYIIFKISNITLKYGLTESYFSGFATLAGIFALGFHKYQFAYQLGLLDLELMKYSNDLFLKCFSKFIICVFVEFYVKHAAASIPLYIEAYKEGIESGNNQYASYSINHLCIRYLLTEKNLETVKNYIDKYSLPLYRLKQEDSTYFFNIIKQFVYSLLNLSADKFKLTGEYFDENNNLNQIKELQFIAALNIFYYFKLFLTFILGDYEKSYIIAKEGVKYISANLGMYQNCIFKFFIAMSFLKNIHMLKKNEKKSALKFLKKQLIFFKEISKSCPENFSQFYYLLYAELLGMKKDYKNAFIFYDKAIQSAKENGYIYIEALANELTAYYYQEKGRNNIFLLYLKESYYCYSVWGAKSKTKELEKKFPEIFSIFNNDESNIDIIKKTFYAITKTPNRKSSLYYSFDLASIIKASQSISSELNMDNLVKSLIKIVIENAGAQKGIVLINKNNELVIESMAAIDNNDIKIMQAAPVNKSKDLCQSIINYVYRTKEIVNLNDASNKGIFVKDEYIRVNKSKSVLCLPIIYQNDLKGILYLENNLIANAFTDEHLEVLKILSSQAAITINNIYLYENTIQKELLEKEMKIASEIQKSMLPEKHPEIIGYNINSVYLMSKEAGGDLYDILKINDNLFLIAIGDVSGKGMPAALYMSSVINMIKILVETTKNNINNVDDYLKDFVIKLNKVLKDFMKSDSFVTLFFALLNTKKNFITYTSLGHIPCYYFNPDNNNLIILKTKGLACGSLSPDIFDKKIEIKNLELEKGSFLILNTDGIIESRNSADIEYNDRFIDIIKSIKAKDGSEEISDMIINDLKEFIGHQNYFDDLTLICIKNNNL